MFANTSLKTKSILVIALLLLMAIIPLVATRESMIRDLLEARLLNKAGTTRLLLASVLADPLRSGDRPALRRAIETLQERDPDIVYVSVLDRAERTVYAQDRSLGHADMLPDEPADFSRKATGDGVLDFKDAILYKGRPIGFVKMGFSIAGLTRDAVISRNQGLRLGLAAFLVALAITYILVMQGFLRPLAELVAATRAMSRGDLSHRVHVQSSDEIGELGAVFNEMAGSIRESQGTLEQRVAQRTQELSFANDLLKRSESQLQTANQDLAAANRLKSEFLANMSHELRTPLNAIIGFSELLQDQVFGQLNERQAKYVSNILTSGRHLLQLINDILDLSKIEAGRMELHLESFSLQDALGEVETIVQPLATRKRVKLQLSLEEDLPAVVADRSKLKQIMYNLLSNATKFTPESGTVTVLAEVSEGQVLVAVRDTGIGIRPEDKDQIFQEFRQADGSAARQYEGTGLGLALTRRFVQMHGGRIWVDSEVGHGSTFTFSLPLRSLETESPILVPGDGAKSWGRDEEDVAPDPLVLVVEDDPQSRELLGLALTQSGYRVAYAVDGDEALDLAAELLPFAVTLDIMLPKRDGWQVLRDLKGDPATEGIPVIIVSILDNRDLGFSLGAADYLVKPVDRAELLKRLGRFSFTTKVKSQVVRVLTIDDDPKAVDLVSTLLHSEGFEVLRAYGGQEGIDKALIELPDAIILDLMMPEVSGFGVIQRLKQDARASRIPIFVLTAMDLTDEVRRELNGQVAAVARKGAGATGELLAELAKLERITPGWSRVGETPQRPSQKPGTAARCNA